MRTRQRAIVVLLLVAAGCTPSRSVREIPPDRRRAELPVPIYGVTLDSVVRLEESIAALKALARKPTTRIVFDEGEPPSRYRTAVRRVSEVGFVMGELLDSHAMKSISTEGFRKRTVDYLRELGGHVDVWEIGNEVNGEWSGTTASVVSKLKVAFELVREQAGKTALTLYYNPECWASADHEMFSWAEKNIPESMRQGMDYVWISYYEEDCNDLKPDWLPVFKRLAALFPNSRLGFGEIGTKKSQTEKGAYLARYYGLRLQEEVDRYAGGYFWWYFRQDMVPREKPLWTRLNEAWKAGVPAREKPTAHVN